MGCKNCLRQPEFYRITHHFRCLGATNFCGFDSLCVPEHSIHLPSMKGILMKLYFSEGACSMASHIALNEAGMKYTPVPVNFSKGESSTPQFLGMNPLGAVPVLELDNGKVLTEGAAIMEYIAAQNPQANLAPKFDTFEYFQFRKWMNFIATELHKGFAPLWSLEYMTKNKDAQNEIREFTINTLNDSFAVLDQTLSKNSYLCGSQYTVADGYLFTIMSWCQYVKIDYSKHKYLAAYVARIGERPAVLKTIKLEESLCN